MFSNKKKALCFLLFISCVHSALSQELFVSILDTLSIYNKEINTKITEPEIGNDYFKLMQGNLNFELKKGEIGKRMIYLNENDDFSVYQMFSPEAFNQELEIPDMEYKYIFLFNKKERKCYFIKYYPSNTKSFSTYTNIDKNVLTLSVNLTGKITCIIELDRHFNPLSAIKFMIIPPAPNKRGDYAELYAYKILRDRIVAKQIAFSCDLNIYEASYNEIKEILYFAKQNCFNKIDSIEKMVEIKKLYMSLESGGW